MAAIDLEAPVLENVQLSRRRDRGAGTQAAGSAATLGFAQQKPAVATWWLKAPSCLQRSKAHKLV